MSEIEVNPENLVLDNSGDKPQLEKPQSKKTAVSRRRFLKTALKATAAGMVVGLPKIENEIQNDFNEEQLKKEIEQISSALKREYNLDISTNPFNNPGLEEAYDITGENASLAEQADALKWFSAEIGKYSPHYVKNSGLKKISISKSLMVGKDNVAGLAIGDNFYISLGGNLGDIYSLAGWLESSTVKETFHHEFFQTAEGIDDEQWAKLNSVGRNAYVRTWQYNVDWKRFDKELVRELMQWVRPTGFAGRYGLKNEGEDQATMGALLMTDPKKVFDIAKEEEVFRKKMEVCLAFFKKLSDGQMDEIFWRDLMAGKVNADYWKNKRGSAGDRLTVLEQ